MKTKYRNVEGILFDTQEEAEAKEVVMIDYVTGFNEALMEAIDVMGFDAHTDEERAYAKRIQEELETMAIKREEW